jgi:hypothetical protein
MLVRRTLAAACVLVIALVIHPLMAFPVALLAALLWLQPRVPWRSTAVLAVTGILLAVGGAYFLGGSTPIMEGRWLLLARLRSAFLFIDQWQLGDWNCTFQTLFTLGLAAGVAQSRDARSLASATLWVASAGLLLAILCTFVNLYVLLQGQPWRWLWVARVVAILLLPGTLFALWRSGTTGRAAALLCGAGWTIMTPISMRSAPILMLGSVLAAASVIIWTLRTRIPRTSDVLLLRGAWAILVCGVLASLVTIRLGEQVRQADADNEPYIVILLTFVAPAIALAIAAWRLAVARGRWIPPLVLVAIGCTLIGTAWPDATDRWFGRKFSSSAAADFADWRKQIPTSAEVFWWEKLREIWFLLERRSYLTLSQETGMLFSEPLAEEVVRRALVLEPLVDTRFWINRAREDPDEPRNLTLPALIAVCQDPELGFVISEVDLGTDAPAKRWPNPEDRIYLYDCGDFREVSTHVPAAA